MGLPRPGWRQATDRFLTTWTGGTDPLQAFVGAGEQPLVIQWQTASPTDEHSSQACRRRSKPDPVLVGRAAFIDSARNLMLIRYPIAGSIAVLV